MTNALRFVLNPGPPEFAQPLDRWSDLVLRQEASLRSGFHLTIYRCPDSWAGSLQDLIASDALNSSGKDPFGPGLEIDNPTDQQQRRLVCKALIPSFNPASQWLEVYELEQPDSADSAVRRVDCLPLQEASNDTCWFYPTEDGRYLSWENQQTISCHPGHVFEQLDRGPNHCYDRAELRVLWSLMADQSNLTCVGLTYQHRRIDFPLLGSKPGTTATWTTFQVDSMSESPLRNLDSVVI
ncbi:MULTISPECIES: hypothetical protein [Synechococcales]|uniref:hypothetical protein n=1 Tax=unclassified Synechococcus TaxID=2626047 RepID=UPI000DB2E0D7|nr:MULTISPECIES: hypothetical protein [unclassified Synechococcus]MCT0212824.1 hypothetical protein [Synechococcus sp. CS-1326]MCT0232868.1 hypothetical protein [Synechococcus sp. CS-1327]PZV01771.1 MAG: hypothetical protein DCF24_03630 [Cyanobium sp.]